MALVFLTEISPAMAVRTVFVRLSYLLFPLSIICGRYFPNIGRSYGLGGEQMFTGLSDQKNSLGKVAMVFGLILLYDLWELRKQKAGPMIRNQQNISLFMLMLGIWVLVASNSKTALVCMLFGAGVLWGARQVVEMKNGRHILHQCLALALSLVVFDKTVGFSEVAVKMLGRDLTYTGRSQLWETISAQHSNPVIGEGFSVFWNTDKGKAVMDALGPLNSAHNGYLEMYLDGGMAALFLIIVLLLSTGRKTISCLFAKQTFGDLGLAFWIVAILYNFSESSFFRLDILWIAFLLVTLEMPRRFRHYQPVQSGRGDLGTLHSPEAFAYADHQRR